MGNWGATNFRTAVGIELQDVIAEFPSSLKQAMYAASQKGFIARGTWNHCALNAAGEELEKAVSSTRSAAVAFNIKENLAQRFISIWDQRPGSDEEATEYLRECILKVGLFTEPGERLPRIVTKRTHESSVKQQVEFDSLLAAGEVPLANEAAELLFAGSVS